jgi:hypothetical protein
MSTELEQERAIRLAAVRLRECAALLDAGDEVGRLLEQAADVLQGVRPERRRE